MKLTPEIVASAEPGAYPDGANGLRLRVRRTKSGNLSRSFQWIGHAGGGRRERNIGPALKMTLVEAREQAATWSAEAEAEAAKADARKREAAETEAAETERQAREAAKAQAAAREAEVRETAIKVAAASAAQAAVERAAARVGDDVFPAFREAYAGACMTALASFNDPLAGYDWIVAANDAWPYMLGATPEEQRETIEAVAVRIADTATRRDWIERVATAARDCATGPGVEAFERPTPGADDPSPVASAPSFAEACAEAVPLFKCHERHRAQVMSRLDNYALRILGPIQIDRITRNDIETVLAPLHRDGKRVALKVRSDMARVFKWAMHKRHCETNPADGDFTTWLPALPERGNYASLDHEDAPDMYAKLDTSNEDECALALLALTGVRAIECALAAWSEFDLRKRVWTIPAERMKAGVRHRVPLSDAAVALLQAREAARDGDYVFPRIAKLAQPQRPLWRVAKRVAPGTTVHGLRSTFREWCDAQEYDYHLAELCIAHAPGSATERAYLRGDALERRKPIMAEWADFLTSATS